MRRRSGPQCSPLRRQARPQRPSADDIADEGSLARSVHHLFVRRRGRWARSRRHTFAAEGDTRIGSRPHQHPNQTNETHLSALDDDLHMWHRPVLPGPLAQRAREARSCDDTCTSVSAVVCRLVDLIPSRSFSYSQLIN